MKMKNEEKTFLKVAVEAAKKAGAVQMRSYGKSHRIHFKGSINLVTEVDGASEEAILAVLKKNFPTHAILTEESGTLGPLSDYKWILDPLDGTTNYAHGYPVFCVSIALEYKGKVVVGVVYDPTRDHLFTAIRGRGAFLNGKLIRVSPIRDLKRALLSTGFAYNVWTEKKNNNLDHFQNFLRNSQAIRRDGAAAIDLCYVACGYYDGFWEIGLKAWDVAAAALILEEAGGKVSLFDGRALDIHAEEIAASNGALHKTMVKVLQEGRV